MTTTTRVPAVSESIVLATRRLLASTGDEDAAIAGRALQAVERLTRHLAQLVGETGARALLARSVALSSGTFSWLAGTIPIIEPGGAPFASLHAALAGQTPHAIIDGFATLLSTFIDLLGRLIGEPIAAHLLHDVWPDVFPAKEST